MEETQASRTVAEYIRVPVPDRLPPPEVGVAKSKTNRAVAEYLRITRANSGLLIPGATKGNGSEAVWPSVRMGPVYTGTENYHSATG